MEIEFKPYCEITGQMGDRENGKKDSLQNNFLEASGMKIHGRRFPYMISKILLMYNNHIVLYYLAGLPKMKKASLCIIEGFYRYE